ncbi:Helix-turn-helix domain-containing protein [Chitinophaga sp. CF118]|uniref:helix-turn-helix domain-containing protein n=1 Tax=Chitinophaga sp. CF118 TaxID=1884367 RepID=UPI0008E5EF0B|nr:AraC family transcriptional regulator [Chitinophaga sp. CF118]SFD08409.1 Helix-turn-helix domain-containing protein [Chitinophaga sp. CF118]
MKKKEDEVPYKFESLSAVHQALGLPKPLHPLISLVNNTNNEIEYSRLPNSNILNFYKISYRINLSGKVKYGQGYYDFNEGGLLFAAPDQLIGSTDYGGDHSGYSLLIHPDLLWSSSLAKKIKQYSFFSYSANEALHLSEQEKATILSIFKLIEEELNSRIDDFSQDVIISQIELLLNCCNRFYKRQFITSEVLNNDILQRMEEILDDYFKNGQSLIKGTPTVQYLSEHLTVSPGYLSDMLRTLTGQSAQQHIHNKIIEQAKEKLSTTKLSVSEIAYELGFERQQSFSTLFKAKTDLSPLEFRQSFN